MSTLSDLWNKLSRSKKYREAFVAAQLKRGIPFQIRALRKQNEGMSQEELARRSGLTQGVISRAEDPDYGNLTLNTIIRIAAGFDVAFVGRFVPFSELGRWFLNQSELSVRVPRFQDDLGFIERKPVSRADGVVAHSEVAGSDRVPISQPDMTLLKTTPPPLSSSDKVIVLSRANTGELSPAKTGARAYA